MKSWIVAGAAALACWSGAADAEVRFDIVESGGAVVITGSGSLDLTGAGLITATTYTGAGSARATDSYLTVGSGDTQGYTGFTGPASMGSGALIGATAATGNAFGFNINPVNDPAGVARTYVPIGYVSGTALAGTATFAGQTLASMGFAVGQYVFSLPNDTITVNIGAAVPEPAAWAMLIAGFGLAGIALRRRPARTAQV